MATPPTPASQIVRAAGALSDMASAQLACTDELAKRSDLRRNAMSSSPDSIAAAFRAIASRRCMARSTAELYDARFNLTAWSGREWLPAPDHATDGATVALRRSGPFIVLSSVVTSDAGASYIRVTTPITCEDETIASVLDGFWTDGHEAWSGGLILSVQGDADASGVPVTVGPDTLGFVREERLAGLRPTSDPWSDVGGALVAFGLLLAVVHVRRADSVMRTATAVALLWIWRYVSVMTGWPGNALPGSLTDPSVYATPFGAGLAASPADLLVSAGVLALSVRWLLRMHRVTKLMSTAMRPIVAGLLLPAVAAALMIFSRSYAAAIKSIVVDSTVVIYETTSLFPDLPTMSLLVSSLLLTWVFAAVWSVAVRSMSAAVLALGFEQGLFRWGSVIIVIMIALGIFSFVDGSGVLPLFLPMAAFIAVLPLTGPVVPEDAGGSKRLLRWSVALLVPMIITLDWHVGEHERDNVRRDAEQRLGSGDAWLTFVMKTDLERLAVDPTASSLIAQADGARAEGTAFRLWSRSVMSRQPANSGIILYDEEGNEVDRFMIGFSTYEQDAALRRVFNGAEERVQLVDGREIGRPADAYGAWATVRDSANRVYGTVASLLSPSKDRPLYWAVGDRQPMLAASDARAEFVGGVAVGSSLRDVRPGQTLSPRIDELLRRPERGWLWVRAPDGDGELLYVRDPRDPARVFAIHRPEEDVRWHVFHLTKVIFFSMAVISLVAILRTVRRAVQERRWGLSFRSRLFIVFGVVSTAPLLLLAVYNTRISEERTTEEVRREIMTNADELTRRIEQLVQSESDLSFGLTNDFAQTLAADVGIEFTVYRQYLVSASSRPEVFESRILDRRLSGDVFAAIAVLGEDLVVERQRIGAVAYAVGYAPWYVNGRRAGIVAIPTLFRQREIEADLAERNAFIFVAYAFALAVMLVAGWYVSTRVTRPISALTDAVRAVGRGEPVASLQSTRSDEIGTLMSAFDTMVRELKENRERLSKAEREEAWREMAKQVAHEIKNPLTPMKLSVQQLVRSFEDRARDREETLREVSRTLLEQIDALSRIATEFSHFARLPHARFTRLDAVGAVRDVMYLFRSIPGITLTEDLPDRPAHVVADEDGLRRVLINILRNAVQAVGDRGGIAVAARRDDGWLTVRVSDTGPGIPESVREKIFEPNFSTKTEGMGLGLAIARRIVEDLGGTLSLVPSEHGACFEIRLPVQG